MYEIIIVRCKIFAKYLLIIMCLMLVLMVYSAVNTLSALKQKQKQNKRKQGPAFSRGIWNMCSKIPKNAAIQAK